MKLSIFPLFFCIPAFLFASGIKAQELPSPQKKKSYSVLSAGPSLKISVTESRVYKVSYEELETQGLLSQSVPSAKIALWGNVSGFLPFYNEGSTYDDLSHLPILMVDGGDQSFDPGDYFLFYGESPHRWEYDASSQTGFSYKRNPFCDKTYYFVGLHAEYPSRVEDAEESASASQTLYTFPEHVRHESDLVNLCSGGTYWFGESFSYSGDRQSITLPVPGINTAQPALLQAQTASATGSGTASFTFECNSQSFSISHRATGNCSDIQSRTATVDLSGSPATISVSYQKSSSAANGYLDWVSLFYTRNMEISDGFLLFRNPEAIGKATAFSISSTQSIQVWDVTDVYRIVRHSLRQNGNSYAFTTEADSILHEYVAFDPAACPAPTFEKTVPAQNLHGLKNLDYLIVSHPLFREQADKIAAIHRERSGLSTYVAETEQIYNEFSSGAKDPSAIRLFMKSIRDRSDSTDYPRYLLLFGAASYDYKDILGSVTDFVPTFESFGNSDEGGGDPLEDNFGYLGDGEGFSPVDNQKKGSLDIAVGRIPVRSSDDADAVVEKIDIYSSPQYRLNTSQPASEGNFGHWRNEITFVTDDGFESSMESSIIRNDYLQNGYPDFHINKLYSDAYERSSTATSNRVPALEKAIRSQFESGSLFVGYLGHSGWDSWSDEKIFSIDIINNLKESYTFPIVMASSCSFAYFDQINKVSGAELAVLRKLGGSIATVATSRTAYTSSIEDILMKFANRLVVKENHEIPTIGDVFYHAKTTNSQSSGHKFILLGDPGLRLAVARHRVITTALNGKSVDSAELDTLKALRPITVEGYIADYDSSLLENFNGTLSIRIYDKPVTKQTLGLYNPIDLGGSSNPYNKVVSYTDQSSMIFQGTTAVVDGKFSFSFIVPKDIAYNYGAGRINYYAYSDSADANGSFERITIGGFYEKAETDTTAPKIRLFIGNDSYLAGTVGMDPSLYAEISDKYGINTTGAGIGHDMTLIIDDETDSPITVNNLFRYNTGSYKEGTLSYPLELEAGTHTAQLKVWNIHNISATERIEFTIDGSDKTKIFDLRAVPNPNRGEYVDFYFNHNNIGGGIRRCEFSIFNLQGALVARFDYSSENLSGHSVGPIRWNLSSGNGSKLQSGMYICHLKIFCAEGNTDHKVTKIVIIKP